MDADPVRRWHRVPAGRASREPMGDTRLSERERRAGVVADASGVVRVRPALAAQPRSTGELARSLATAGKLGLRVTVAGTRHSGGGQSLQDGTMLLDMRGLDGMRYDAATGALHVQPGATWDQVQRYLDPLGRSVAVQQSSNVFSVGGSLAANIHGRDVRFGPIVDSVEAVKVMLANGREVVATPTHNAQLFAHAIGGYGQGGIITEARLKTVPNEQYERSTSTIDIDELPRMMRSIASDPQARLLQVRLPVAGSNAFEQAQVIQFRNLPGEAPEPLKPSKPSPIGDFVGQLAMKAMIASDLAKQAAWHVQKLLPGIHGPEKGSRNHIMSLSAESLRSNSREHSQVLQEYFVPPERTPEFLRRLRSAVDEHDANLLNVTLRWTPRESTSTALPYARRDSVGAVLYLDQKRSDPSAQQRMDAFTRAASQAALEVGGTFYLPYQLGAFSPTQLATAYPERDAFLATARSLDPADRFAGSIESIGSHADPLRHP